MGISAYVLCVAVYYLFGICFLPEDICATGAYILGAFAFPFIVPIVVLAVERLMGVGGGTRASDDDRTHNRKTWNSWVHRGNTGGAVRRRYTRDLERRLLRARTEALEVEEYLDDTHRAAIIYNHTSGGRYRVTERTCECEDFKKRGLPCKHILFLSLQTERYLQYEVEPTAFFRRNYPRINREGKAIPRYWDFYDGKPKWLGYTNLRLYHVSGREYGVSEKTGRATNHKKTVNVNATDEEDARRAAEALGVSPPYSEVELIDLCPTYPQYGYLHAVGIPVPYLVSADDISALLTRYEDEDDEICPEYIFELATKCRVRVSYFQSPRSVKSAIWSETPETRKAAMFCYAVYCAGAGFDLGQAPMLHDAAVFAEFQPTEKEWRYILGIQEFGWRTLHANASAYKSAAAFLRERGVL